MPSAKLWYSLLRIVATPDGLHNSACPGTCSKSPVDPAVWPDELMATAKAFISTTLYDISVSSFFVALKVPGRDRAPGPRRGLPEHSGDTNSIHGRRLPAVARDGRPLRSVSTIAGGHEPPTRWNQREKWANASRSNSRDGHILAARPPGGGRRTRGPQSRGASSPRWTDRRHGDAEAERNTSWSMH